MKKSEGRISTRCIGRCGELYVQYELLRMGIESALLTTDTGIDLVAYILNRKKAITIQVKTNLRTKPAGGKGSPYMDWWIPENCPADYVALVCISKRKCWFIPMKRVPSLAQQHSNKRYHLYMRDESNRRIKGKHLRIREEAFDVFVLERQLKKWLQ